MSMLDQKPDSAVHTEQQEEHREAPGPYRPRVERRRPGWAVAALVWATLGIYPIIWAGINWSELRRERQDDRMYPVWHSIAVLVPIYGLFRFHANFRVINEQLEQTRSSHRVQPLIAVLTFFFGSVVAALPYDAITHGFVNIVAGLAAMSWAIYHGQTGMNAYWDARIERRTSSALRLWERMLLGFGAGIWFLFILGLLLEIRMG
jgi:hypothetical protein